MSSGQLPNFNYLKNLLLVRGSIWHDLYASKIKVKTTLDVGEISVLFPVFPFSLF